MFTLYSLNHKVILTPSYDLGIFFKKNNTEDLEIKQMTVKNPNTGNKRNKDEIRRILK